MYLLNLVGVLFFVIYSANGSAKSSEKCIENRAAFDVGSGVTRVVVAAVDKCSGKIIKELMHETIQVSYKDELEISKNNTLPAKVIDQGIKALKELSQKAKPFHPNAYVGVATSVFRQASNGPAAIKKVAKESNVALKVINQDEEAYMGFYGALAATGLKSEQVVVWDIGGGSMQFIGKKNVKDPFLVYKGQLASNGFKNTIITKLQNRKLHGTISSPNPMKPKVAKAAQKIAEKEAKNVDSKLRGLVSSSKREVLGIGGVHYYSIRGQTGKKTVYDLPMVQRAIKKRSLMTDKELGGKYAPTDVSNLILVAGFMKKLGIKKVRAIKVNMAHGLLINELYW